MMHRATRTLPLLLACSCASAQPEARTVGDLIERLDSESLATRDGATLRLFDEGVVTLAQVEALLRTEDLSAEQRLRLEQVALALFFRGPRAALGISFGGSHPRGTVISRTVEGFHAAEVLRAGDIVLSADGIPTGADEALRVAILARSPGELMRIELLRAGETRTVEVELGSFNNLSSAMRPPEDSLFAAWAVRRARHATPDRYEPLAPVSDPALDAPVWPERGSEEWAATFRAGDAPRGIVVGGQARQSADLSPETFRGGPVAQALVAQAERQAVEFQAMLGLLKAQRVDVINEAKELEERLASGRLTQAERRLTETKLIIAQERLAQLDQRITQLELGARINIPRPD